MFKKIGILGSRDLAVKILKWVITQDNIEIVGGVAPPFKGWWHDQFEIVLLENKIPVLTFDELIACKPDIIFSINYWKIIDQHIFSLIPGGIVNIHHSYLLKYRGRYSTSWAIINARKLNLWIHGTSLHYISSTLDGGNIIDSQKCPIYEDDTAKTLFERVENLAFEMFKENFIKVLIGVSSFLEPDPQPLYYDQSSIKNLEIKYGVPLEEVYDYIRAWTFNDRPKPFFNFNENKIYLSL